ncbi:MAG: DNA polymerase I [Bacteroidales bacterium]|jgi:DNA polymerase-1|nr:DNA polymerase I [Bacteroidales bacterium]
MDKLFLIDGHALVFKMYYAFLRRPMINSQGADMSILYGFTKYLLEMLEREKPTHVAVAFDPPGGTFRNQLYPAYKGTRPPTPQLVIDALEPLTQLVQALQIPVLMVPGFEADDVLGSAATQYASDALDVYMVTPDKDYGQLIGPHAFQYKPGKSGSDAEIWGIPELCAKWGISEPAQVIDMLAICGDSADNVPGVKGVGEVGAAKLIARYGSLENIYAHLAELPPRQQEQFREAEPYIGLSKTLVTIKTDMELPVTLKDMRYTGQYAPDIVALFDQYEFASLKKYLKDRIIRPDNSQTPCISGAFCATAGSPEPPVTQIVPQTCSVRQILDSKPEKIGLVFTSPSKLLICAGQNVAVTTDPREAQTLLEDPTVSKYGVDLKRLSNGLAAEGIGLEGQWNDIELMHYVLNPERSHELAALAQTYLGVSLEASSTPAQTGSLFDDIPEEDDTPRLLEAAVLVPLGDKLRENLPPFYDQMEEPLAKVLAVMERDGVKVDMEQIRHFADGLRKELAEREARIREMAGDALLNISSPKQVGELLFDKLRLDPKAKKSGKAGQYSTDEATLLAIADRHPIVEEILEFRAVKKLLSTYIEPFPSYISPVDGRVHTTFNQALTATGRLSSSNPNLQNIPVRTERGKEIRKAFVPGTPEGIIVSADYSQIELRIMAHLSGDEHLTQAFREGADVHAATAAKIFGIPVSEVTREQRGMAKTANFGIMYGISSFGLAQRLHLSRSAAKELIDGYFASFPSIRSFIDDSIAFARENGYVQTLFGRRRYLPDIHARNATVRALAERNAVNAPIQGTSADIIKLAMIGVAARLREAGLRSKMVLQIHDELLFDALPEELPQLEALVKDVMEHVIALSVPLTVECSAGANWLEAH